MTVMVVVSVTVRRGPSDPPDAGVGAGVVVVWGFWKISARAGLGSALGLSVVADARGTGTITMAGSSLVVVDVLDGGIWELVKGEAPLEMWGIGVMTKGGGSAVDWLGTEVRLAVVEVLDGDVWESGVWLVAVELRCEDGLETKVGLAAVELLGEDGLESGFWLLAAELLCEGGLETKVGLVAVELLCENVSETRVGPSAAELPWKDVRDVSGAAGVGEVNSVLEAVLMFEGEEAGESVPSRSACALLGTSQRTNIPVSSPLTGRAKHCSPCGQKDETYAPS